MQIQMDDLHMIIANREYLESTVSDKVTELETWKVLKTWKLSDAMRVGGLRDLQSQLPEGSQSEIREEDFQPIPTELHLHCYPYESLPPPVDTSKVLKSLKTIREIFPADYPEKYRRVLSFRKHPRTE